MKKKILITVFTLNLFGFIGCCDHLKYYVYNGIDVVVRNAYITQNDILSFGYNYRGSNYLLQVKNNINLGISLYAYDCDRGYGGAKHPLVRISVTSDSDFDDAHPANTPLNDIIYANGITLEGEIAYGRISELITSDFNFAYM